MNILILSNKNSYQVQMILALLREIDPNIITSFDDRSDPEQYDIVVDVGSPGNRADYAKDVIVISSLEDAWNKYGLRYVDTLSRLKDESTMVGIRDRITIMLIDRLDIDQSSTYSLVDLLETTFRTQDSELSGFWKAVRIAEQALRAEYVAAYNLLT